jgi:NADPH:quinone reductase-like Zn-dependent oxidoreductase
MSGTYCVATRGAYWSFGDISHGGFAEYACARQTRLVSKPANLSFEEAAAVPMAALTALQGLRDTGRIQPGQKVLINGASRGVGTFAVQIAKSFGAEVTAVCSPWKMDTARSIGADQVIDYTKEDFTKNAQAPFISKTESCFAIISMVYLEYSYGRATAAAAPGRRPG